MRLEFDDDEEFLYDALSLTIVAVGKNRGYNPTVAIRFKNLRQALHFKEMLEFIEEKRKELFQPNPLWPNEPCGRTLDNCPFDKQQHSAYHDAYVEGKV